MLVTCAAGPRCKLAESCGCPGSMKSSSVESVPSTIASVCSNSIFVSYVNAIFELNNTNINISEKNLKMFFFCYSPLSFLFIKHTLRNDNTSLLVT